MACKICRGKKKLCNNSPSAKIFHMNASKKESGNNVLVKKKIQKAYKMRKYETSQNIFNVLCY